MSKQQTYLWEGTDKEGNRKKGEIRAENPAIAQNDLSKQGITARKIKLKKESLFSLSFSTSKKSDIKPHDVLVFTRQLTTMLKAGLPIVKAFEILGRKHENKQMGELILSLGNDVSSGLTFAEALAKRPEYFDNLFCSLVATGEQSGTLDIMLERIATYQEKAQTLKKKIKKASMYPLVVFSTTFIAGGILLIFVVPTFQNMFNSFGAELPAFTKMVVNLSEFLQAHWIIIVALIGAVIWGFKYGNKHIPDFSLWVDKMTLRLPVAGMILQKSIIARFTRTLATTLSAGMPIADAMVCVTNVIDNKIYKNALIYVKDSVISGQPMNVAIEKTDIFPNLVSKMIAVGEESGSLEDMLNKIATYFEDDVDALVDNLSALLEPIIMVVLGVIIGGFVVAMYLPIFRIGTVM